MADRERTARRLLGSSARKWYDPEIDIDWDAPLEPAYCIPPHRVSLYGTELWDRLDEAQRMELSKHEAASMASSGVWFEIILMRMLCRHLVNLDPTSAHVQYALTEIADECRHSVMFGRAIERLGAPPYGPQRLPRVLSGLMVHIAHGPSMYGAILLAEELLDRMQREAMADERVQPLVRMVNRIHVLEEARHVRFAREELLRSVAGRSRASMLYHRQTTARAALVVSRTLLHPLVYASVGLDPRAARRVALGNPHYQRTLVWAAERVVAFFREAGLLSGNGGPLWRRSYLLPAAGG
ncbi:MAG TPA: diiron oxygenase [Pseudonocardiaceae bacterium]